MVTSVTSSSSAQTQQLLQQAADARAKQNSETIGAAPDRDSGTADAIADARKTGASQTTQSTQASSTVNKQNSVNLPEPPQPPEQPKPVVNTSGQVTGTTINTTA
ncbi:hypothetical protein [Undibacterium sp. TJN19]|uniref:hypothetical protein n=1 Tax=Undibacterium sp. TJN19 TaxID=3413055 RepID=UPI003BF2BD2A